MPLSNISSRRFQHIFDENAVAPLGIVHQDLSVSMIPTAWWVLTLFAVMMLGFNGVTKAIHDLYQQVGLFWRKSPALHFKER